MPLQFVKLLFVFIFGYLFIGLLPELSNVEDFIAQLVLNPVRFLAVATAFFVGSVLQGELLKTEIELLKDKKNQRATKRLLLPLHALILYGLICFGGVETLVFFLTAAIYGIISIDFRG